MDLQIWPKQELSWVLYQVAQSVKLDQNVGELLHKKKKCQNY